MRVTHPDRVLFPAQRRHQARPDRALPVDRRPASCRMSRTGRSAWCAARDGIASECFFQKHASDGFPDEFETGSRSRRNPARDEYLIIEDERGLVAAVQMGVLELHIWGCHVDDVEKPDRHGVRLRSRRRACRSRKCATARKEMRERLKQTRAGILSDGRPAARASTWWCRSSAEHSWDEHREFRRSAGAGDGGRGSRTASSPTCRRPSARERSSSTICATRAARRRSRRSRRGRGRAPMSRRRCPGRSLRG